MKHVLVAILRGYQSLISPFLGANCRFFPSCSDYTREALEKKGARQGLWLGVKRILKCHPFHPGGVDVL